MPVMQVVDTSMGEKEIRIPPRPRIKLGLYEIVPAMDDEWQPIQDLWMLPGRAQPMTTEEVRGLADARGLAFEVLN